MKSSKNVLTTVTFILILNGFCLSQHCFPLHNNPRDHHDIDYFQIGDFVHADETFYGGYVDYYDSLSIGLSLFAEQEIVISKRINPYGSQAGNTVGFKIWIDYNNDFEFEENEKIWDSGWSGGTFESSYQIPSDKVFIGDRRMRVRSEWGDVPDSPCGTLWSGETEDYKVNISEFQGANGSTVTFGNVFIDSDGNCFQDNEIGIEDRILEIQPAGIFTQTNSEGFWYINNLAEGNYTIMLDTTGNWESACPIEQTFTVGSDIATMAPSFGMYSSEPCPDPTISVDMPFMRPCFPNQKIYVQCCNTNYGSGSLENAYAILTLDLLIMPTGSSLPYSDLGDNQYKFTLGTIIPGQCVDFWIDNTLSCDAELGQGICIEGELFPRPDCVYDDLPLALAPTVQPCNTPWDYSSLDINGYCENDSIYFEIINLAALNNGNMDCFHPVRVYQDGGLIFLDSIQLLSQQKAIYAFKGIGQSWHISVDQHPNHPGTSTPNATVENCGGWTQNTFINNFAQNDGDPIIDIFCGEVTGSYDPNDKTGYPLGITDNHLILPNQQLEYKIRFQNTGTDTAFTVVVRDTLDKNLNIHTIKTGAASDRYDFRIYGPRVLEWTFNNILLPDSIINEPESHGFLTFKVNQNNDLPNGTKLNNSAGIYFDYNDPIITNVTSHIVDDMIQIALYDIDVSKDDSEISIYPNPHNGLFTIDLNNTFSEVEIQIFNNTGQIIFQEKYINQSSIDINKNIDSGIYFVSVIRGVGKRETFKMVKY